MTLLSELGVSRENVTYVLNRTARRTEIKAKDVQGLFTGYDMLGEVPADFRALQPFINTGTLMSEARADIPLTRALRQLAAQVVERMPVARAA